MVSHFLTRMLPKEPGDRIGFLFFIVATNVVALFELFIILPYIDGDRTGYFWFHVVLGLSIYINVYISFYKLSTTDSSVLSCRSADGLSTLPPLQRPGWFYCSACGVNAPPRSYHCHMCNLCVLRRDHHCLFAGVCVGHWNQRHFLTLLLFTLIGSAYATYLNSDYVLETLDGFSLKSLLTMILPMLAWTTGFSGASTFFVAFVSSLCIVGFCGLTMLLVYHLRHLIRGQTCHEYTAGVRDYDCGVRSNVETVFGHRWYVAWISSLIPSEPLGDGIEFRRRYLYENIKDI